MHSINALNIGFLGPCAAQRLQAVSRACGILMRKDIRMCLWEVNGGMASK
jgi:hypothetical protein